MKDNESLVTACQQEAEQYYNTGFEVQTADDSDLPARASGATD